jgi:hypothetical protein
MVLAPARYIVPKTERCLPSFLLLSEPPLQVYSQSWHEKHKGINRLSATRAPLKRA